MQQAERLHDSPSHCDEISVRIATLAGCCREGLHSAYSVEKLRHAKIASEIWNAVPTIG
jgi:hypothetical protein